MTQPLALIFYERLLPGTQVVNALRDLHYRVQTLTDAGAVANEAEASRPFLILADLQPARGDILAAIRRIRKTPDTAHLPILAFTADDSPAAAAAGREAGATLVVQDEALLGHLPQWLDRVLQVE